MPHALLDAADVALRDPCFGPRPPLQELLHGPRPCCSLLWTWAGLIPSSQLHQIQQHPALGLLHQPL